MINKTKKKSGTGKARPWGKWVKVCSKCKKNKRRASLFDSICKSCKNKANQPSKKRRYQENRWKLWNYLVESGGCVDCGEKSPIVLELDHISGRKKKAISRMICDGASWTTLLAELKKCEIRCCNCHRIKTTRDLMHAKHQAFRLGVAAWQQTLDHIDTHRQAFK